MDAFGAGRKRRRLQLAAARQRKVDVVDGVSVADESNAETEPAVVADIVASDSDDSSLTVDEPQLSTSATERKFALMAGGVAAGETEGESASGSGSEVEDVALPASCLRRSSLAACCCRRW